MSIPNYKTPEYHLAMESDLLLKHRKAFGARLRKARKGANISQENLALKLAEKGILGKDDNPLSQPTIGSWERGKRYPENELTFYVLAEILGIFPSALLGFEEAPQNEDEALVLKQYREADLRGKQQIKLVAGNQVQYTTKT